MVFPIEKILTMSAQDFVGPDERVQDKYDLYGVHYFQILRNIGDSSHALKEFAERVPSNATVVTDFRDFSSITHIQDYLIHMVGTALVHK